MSFKRVVAYNATNTQDAAVKIKNTMKAAGWTLHDDQSGSNYYVLSSNGEAGDLMTVYVKISWNTANQIRFNIYLYWDNASHTGVVKLGNEVTYTYITADDGAAFWLWIYCDKNCISAISKAGSVYRAVTVQAITPFWPVKGKLISAASAGTNVVLELNTGEASNFETGVTYQIVGAGGEGRENATVNAVNTGADTITVDNLDTGYSVDSVIGQVGYTWTIQSSSANMTYLLSRSSEGISDETYNSVNAVNMLDATYTDPDNVGNQRYTLWPVIYQDRSYGTVGYGDDYLMKASCGTTYEDSIGVGKKDSGAATGGSVSALDDTGKSWAVNALAGKAIVLTGGAGAGDVRKISSNTETQIVPDVDFSATPDGTTTYAVYDEAWRYFYFGTTANARAFREI